MEQKVSSGYDRSTALMSSQHLYTRPTQDQAIQRFRMERGVRKFLPQLKTYGHLMTPRERRVGFTYGYGSWYVNVFPVDDSTP